jgi:FMN phosphatase YigB (HAD superfamily)
MPKIPSIGILVEVPMFSSPTDCSGVLMKKISNVLIDFDGTLNESEPIFASKLDGILDRDGRALFQIYLHDIHRTVVHENYPDKHDDVAFHWGLLLQRIGASHDVQTVNLLTNRYRDAENAIFKRPRLFPDVTPFLERAVNSGYHLCLSTGGGNSLKKAEAVTRVLSRNYFAFVLGEETLDQLKHDPSYYEAALKTLSWKAGETVSIGDTILTDIYPAKVVGINTIWVNRKNEEPPTHRMRRPDHETSNLILALDFLEKQTGKI